MPGSSPPDGRDRPAEGNPACPRERSTLPGSRHRTPRHDRHQVRTVVGAGMHVAHEAVLADLAESGENEDVSAASIAPTRNTPSSPAPVTATRTPPPVLATKTPTSAYRDAGFGNFM